MGRRYGPAPAAYAAAVSLGEGALPGVPFERQDGAPVVVVDHGM